MNKINIIWTAKADWELDYIQNVLLKDTPFNLYIDHKFEVVLPNSIIVTNEKYEDIITTYLNRFTKNNYKFGIIHLSDESYSLPTSFYKRATFVVRNYYSKKYAELPNVDFFPLGYKSGFTHEKDNIPISKRPYVWSFAGQIAGKLNRELMINTLAEIDGGYFYATQQWDDSKALKTQEYRDILDKTVFAPCPSGWCNPDSFRLYEALEAGCIPIVDNKAYFDAMFHTKPPFLSVISWADVEGTLCGATGNLEEIQNSCRAWWVIEKHRITYRFRNQVASMLKETK